MVRDLFLVHCSNQGQEDNLSDLFIDQCPREGHFGNTHQNETHYITPGIHHCQEYCEDYLTLKLETCGDMVFLG